MRTEDGVDTARFGWVAEAQGDALVISFRGDLDLAVADECRAGLVEPLEGAERSIIFDLSELEFVDSTGLRLLVDVKQQTEAHGKRVLIGEASSAVVKLFEVTGLTSWFEYIPGREPRREVCSACDGEIVSGARRCPRCGSAL